MIERALRRDDEAQDVADALRRLRGVGDEAPQLDAVQAVAVEPVEGHSLADALEAPRAPRPRVRREADPARVCDRPADRVCVEALVVDRLVEPEREQVVAPPRRHLDAREQQHVAVPALLAAPPGLERVVVGQQHDVHLRAPARAGDLPDRAGAVRVGRVEMDDAGEVVHPSRPSRGRA